MVNRLRAGRYLVLAASGLFVCRIAVSLALIPPWQQPDEPSQVAFVEVSRNRMLLLRSSDPGREAEILRSMFEYEWWRHNGRAMPVPLPARFSLSGAAGVETLGVDPTTSGYPRLYYMIIAAALSFAPQMSVVNDMYVMRAFSAVLALLTLWVAWRGVGVVFGDAAGTTVAVLLAVHPQFAVVATTASPDALVNLAGACLWWQVMQVVRRENVIWSVATMWLAASLGAAADRMGVPLLVSACAVSVFAILQTGLRRSTVALAGGAVMLLGAALWLASVFWGTLFGVAAWHQLIPVARARTWEFLAEFSSFLFESWWFSLGWVRYAPPSWWVTVALVLAIGSILGLIGRLRRDDTAHVRAVISLAMVITAVQIAAGVLGLFQGCH